MGKESDRAGLRGQLSAAGVLIGCVGCVVITASSVYTALKMGALPWPTIFTSLTALVLLRAVGRTSLNEANITQVIMSAGSMVAGGLAFTIPGIWILHAAGGGADAGGEAVSWPEMLAVALAGTLLGLVCTALIRRHFVDESDLEYPIGTAAAETLLASHAGGSTGRKLFGSMAAAGVWTVARDVLGWIPSMVAQLPLPGVAFGVQLSPMRLAIGFLVGGRSIAFWFAGAVLAAFGITLGGTALGLWDTAGAQGVVSSLGMGLMMGSGAGVVVKDVIWPALRSHALSGAKLRVKVRTTHGVPSRPQHLANITPGNEVADSRATDREPGDVHFNPEVWQRGRNQRRRTGVSPAQRRASRFLDAFSRADAGVLAFMAAAAALIACVVLGLGPVVSVVIVLMAFVTAVMSAQSVGQSGIDPMEIFGLIVLLFVAAFARVTQVQLFFVAGIVAVACGLAGDVMSDFKTGRIIGTDPRTLWFGQVVGALLGAVVAVAVLVALVAAYGTDAFGGDGTFVAAQAEVVATMVAGVPSVPAFALGLGAGAVLYCAGIPAMMLGLGVYLPFYMSLSAALGAVVRWAYDRACAARGTDAQAAEETGVVVASGLLGGESIVGVIVAFASVAAGLMG